MSANIRKKLWVIAGVTALCLGSIGIFIPVMPTTPFVLCAAFCFAKGSTKILYWLENNKLFGQVLKDYRAGLGVPLSTKIMALAVLWGGMIISMVCVQKLWVAVTLTCIGIAVTIHLCCLKTRNRDSKPRQSGHVIPKTEALKQ